MKAVIEINSIPESCYRCDYNEWFEDCPLNKGIVRLDDYKYYRHEDCPIVDLEDMRLIDANQFEVISYKGIPEGYEDNFDSGVMWLSEQIDKADTVI